MQEIILAIIALFVGVTLTATIIIRKNKNVNKKNIKNIYKVKQKGDRPTAIINSKVNDKEQNGGQP